MLTKIIQTELRTLVQLKLIIKILNGWNHRLNSYLEHNQRKTRVGVEGSGVDDNRFEGFLMSMNL